MVGWPPVPFPAAAANQTFLARHGALRLQGAFSQSSRTDDDAAISGIVHGRGREAAAVLIRKQDGKATVHHADERVGGAEINAEDGGGGGQSSKKVKADRSIIL